MDNIPEITSTLEAMKGALTLMASRDDQYHRERAEHASDMKVMSNSIQALTKSSEKLHNSVNELLMNSKLTEHQMAAIETNSELRHRELRDKLNNVEIRVSDLEHHRSQSIGERAVNDRSRVFWQVNWYKFVVLFVASMPVIYAIYGLINTKSGGG